MMRLENRVETKGNLLERLFSLKGKTALITGGYKGIGMAIADTYAEAGSEVVIAARNRDRCVEAARVVSDRHGVRAVGKEMNVTDSRMVAAVLKEVIDEFGKIDILVNCAGIPGSEKSFLRMTDDDMSEVMNVDFIGTFLVSRAVAQQMVKRKTGKIINISSILGKIAARNMAGYCASKAAVIQLTRVMALDLIQDNIQVNVICPGYFTTEFSIGFLGAEAGRDFLAKKVPMRRAGDLDEIKSTALYLATCPSFMTGSEISIDGGHSIV